MPRSNLAIGLHLRNVVESMGYTLQKCSPEATTEDLNVRDLWRLIREAREIARELCPLEVPTDGD